LLLPLVPGPVRAPSEGAPAGPTIHRAREHRGVRSSVPSSSFLALAPCRVGQVAGPSPGQVPRVLWMIRGDHARARGGVSRVRGPAPLRSSTFTDTEILHSE